MSVGYVAPPTVPGLGLDLAVTLMYGLNVRWIAGQYTFSIPTAQSTWGGYSPGGSGYGYEPFMPGSRTFTSAEAELFRSTFRVWDDLIAPDFIETDGVSNTGNIRIAYTGDPGANYAYIPPTDGLVSMLPGDIWLGIGMEGLFNATTSINDRIRYVSFQSHEIGHALGLRHPFDTPGFNNSYESTRYTIMAYNTPSDGVWFTFTPSGTSALPAANVVNVFPRGPMVFDIAAIQALYGADLDTRAGDNTYAWNDSNIIFESLYDAGGIDAFDLSLNRRGSIVDLTPGSYSSISRLADLADLASLYLEIDPVAFPGATAAQQAYVLSILQQRGEGVNFLNRDNLGIAYSTVIENVIGSRFDDVIIGNLANNHLRGGAGNDVLSGYEGDDLLEGGAGNDSIDGGLGANTAVFGGPRSAYSISWNGRVATVTGPDGADSLTNVAWLRFADQTIAATPDAAAGILIHGGVTDNVMAGTDFNDTFFGMAGSDTLSGGGGDDVLNGGAGNDVLDGGAGIDTVDYAGTASGVSVDLVGSVAIGGAGSDIIRSIENVTGSSWDDTLIGDAGANILNGGGGSDLLRGGGGNDRLIAGATQRDAPDLIKSQTTVNNSLQTAISLDGFFDLRSDSSIFRSTEIPHATVRGTAHGQGYEYFAVSVRRGDIVNLDMDTLTVSNLLWPGIDLLDSTGNPISITRFLQQDADPFNWQFTSQIDGLIYIRVGKPGPEVGNPSDPRPGQTYLLNVSVSSQTLDPQFNIGSTLYGEDGDDVLVSGSGNDTLDGGTGLDTATFGVRFSQASVTTDSSGAIIITSSEGRDTLRGTEMLQFADGIYDVGADGRVAGQARMILTGDGGANALVGGASNDTINGNAGNDTLRGAGGNDILDGGAGFDAAVYIGLRRQYVASSTGVSGNGEGTDTLTGIEEARFVDGVLSFDADSAYAQVARLFDAVLDRLPDQAGMEFQANALLTGGLTLLQLTDNFIQSAEFQARFGGLSNAAFIDNLFRFSLGRSGDAAGIQAWVDVLNSGVSRAQVVMNFSESPEHRQQLAPFVNAGMWIPDAGALMIARLYDAAFERLPDPAGLTAWLAALDSGAPLLQIAATFAASPEFQLTYGSLTNQQFVEQIYRACLDREGDAAGVQAWTTVLDQGATRAQVLVSFSESPEHVNLTAPQWSGGIRYPVYVGSAVEEVAPKGIDEALVLPGHIEDQVYDPADPGLTQITNDDDGFVLPSDPDGGLPPCSPTPDDDSDVVSLVGDMGLPMPDGGEACFVVPAHLPVDEPGSMSHRGDVDWNWA